MIPITPVSYTHLDVYKRQALTRDKSELGFPEVEMRRFDYLVHQPHGIILVTGPTGSGKSTTLYTVLSELNEGSVNIVTVEDPVEADVDGINQVQVNEKDVYKRQVMETGANNVFVIETKEGKEVLFPVIPDCIKKVDTKEGIVRAHVMKGLIE